MNQNQFVTSSYNAILDHKFQLKNDDFYTTAQIPSKRLKKLQKK